MESAYSGKVREVYDAGEDRLIILTTDRISAFDVIMPTPIPRKGIILNKLSKFWFDLTKDIAKTHVISTQVSDYPAKFQNPDWQDRSMMVKNLDMVMIECVVSGYLTGSCYKSYKKTGEFCGNKLPEGMVESQKLPEPIFCASTKAEFGEHDVYISFDEAKRIGGAEIMEKLKKKSIEVYKKCADYALARGMIIADTKFEFGIDVNGDIVLGDEIVTPDSSRFWLVDDYKIGEPQKSFDKQYLRDWLSSKGLAGVTPPPELPQEVCNKTAEKYAEAYRIIVGEDV